MNIRDKAIEQLRHGKTISIANGNEIVTSEDRGISFLLEHAERGGALLRDAFVADKVVGRAAALLFVKCGVKEVYAEVMSFPAEEILIKYGIIYKCKLLTQGIVNRAGDGPCPMENAVLEISDPNIALSVLRNKLNELRA